MDENRSLVLWLPAGIVLTVLGLLTLATPLFAPLSPPALLLDTLSGICLALAGLFALRRGAPHTPGARAAAWRREHRGEDNR